jgi:hypothetical protein
MREVGRVIEWIDLGDAEPATGVVIHPARLPIGSLLQVSLVPHGKPQEKLGALYALAEPLDQSVVMDDDRGIARGRECE